MKRSVATGDDQLPLGRKPGNALRLGQTADASDDLAPVNVDLVDRAIGDLSDEQAVVCQVDRKMIDTPFRLYVGNLPVSALPLTLAHQALWTIALVFLGRYLLARALQRMVVQGG